MDIRFNRKTALVTGAGRGIGRSVAKALYEGGATVYALSKDQDNLDTLKIECENIHCVSVDLADWSATRRAVEDIGPIDLLVNNAGVNKLSPFLEMDEESYDWIMNINLKAAINVAQVVARGMKERGKGGCIVNVSSQAALRPLPDHTAYCASKAALNSVTKVMALELGPYNIRTNAVCPTVVLTDLGKKSWSDAETARPMLSKIPLGRFAEVEDCIGPILYLLSDQSAMVNGVAFPVDGGFSA